VGTHGRSIYILDDISALQQMPLTVDKGADAVMFPIRPAVAWTTDIQRAIVAEGAKIFRAQNPARGSAIAYWFKAEPQGEVRITIADVTGREVRVINGTRYAGLNRVQWDLLTTPPGRRGGAPVPAAPGGGGGGGRGTAGTPVAPGSYLVKITVGDRIIGQQTAVVEPDTTFEP
jgi:hypothetical protein